MEPRIVHYDFAEFRYASFFWTGFQENARSNGYRFEVRKRPPSFLRAIGADWGHMLQSVCLFKLERESGATYFCIDGRDSSRTALSAGQGFHLPLLETVDQYFKVNFNRRHIEEEAPLRPHASKVIPILPFFPVRPARRGPFLPRLSPSRTGHWTLYDSVRRGKQLLTMPTLDEIRRLRGREKKHDVFFVVKCYGNPIHDADNEFRYRLVQELRNRKDIDSVAGLIGDLKGKFREFSIPELELMDYLGQIAESRVAIYIRGMFDCLSFKLGQYLALGLPIVGQALKNNAESIMKSDGFPAQFGFEEPTAIIDRVASLLRKRDEMKALGDSNVASFEARFTPKAVVGEVLRHLLPR